jgi:hypothetical protein
MHFLADALQRMQQATQRDHIEYLRIDNGAVLRGYYMAGAVGLVEYQAASRRLQSLYEEKLGMRAAKPINNWAPDAPIEEIVGYTQTEEAR